MLPFLPVDRYGRIELDALKDAFCEDTILVSIMYVNNEVGSVQPIQEAASMVKRPIIRTFCSMWMLCRIWKNTIFIQSG